MQNSFEWLSAEACALPLWAGPGGGCTAFKPDKSGYILPTGSGAARLAHRP